MPINTITDDLIHDHSVGLDDDDIAYNNGGAVDLETLSNDFYQALVDAGLITDGVDADTTFGDNVGIAASPDNWITVSGEEVVNELRFAADGAGAALDGDIWTDTDAFGVPGNVLTADTDEIIYLYAVDGGTMLVGSTTDPASFGSAPTTLSDFSTSSIVIVGYLDAAEDNETAEVYFASFRPVTNPDDTEDDNDTVDLGDNVWLFGDTQQVLTFSGLDPKKFLFGIAGDDASSTKLFVLGENYNVDTDEEREKGNTSGAELNTSSAGKFDLFPDIDVATVGVDNQSVNPDQGIFVMLVDTTLSVGNYYDGNDADAIASTDILTQSSMGFGIVQAVGDTSAIQVEISGYLSEFTGSQLIEDNGASDGDPDETLGDTDDIVGIESVTIRTIVDGVEYQDTALVGDTTIDLNGRIVTLAYSGGTALEPTLVTLTGVAAQDLITVNWVSDVDHALLHTKVGAIDWGIVEGSFGGAINSNIGEHMLVDDDGPLADVNNDGIEPGPAYLFDGNTDASGNFEGDNGTGAPTGDDPADEDPTSVTVDFSDAFTTDHDNGTDTDTDGTITTATAYSLVLAAGVTDVMMGGDQAESGGVGLVWATDGDDYIATAGAGGDEVFRLSVDSSGMVTFSLSGVLDQTSADSSGPFSTDLLTLDDDQIAVRRTDTLTDNDGDESSDSADVDLGGNFGVGDDGPVAEVTVGSNSAVRYLFDGNLADGNYEGNNDTALPTVDALRDGDPLSTTIDLSGSFGDNHAYGADGEASTTTTHQLVLNAAVGGAVMMVDTASPTPNTTQATSDGVGLVWAAVTDGYAAMAGGDEIFRLTADNDGIVTFQIMGVLDHPMADDSPITSDILTLADGQVALQRSDTIVDNDGDSSTDSKELDLGGAFGVGDDAPIVDVTADATPSEIAALGVNLDETIDPDDNQLPNGADNYASGEVESVSATDDGSSSNGDVDDVVIGGVANTPIYDDAPTGSQAIGRLTSSAGQITALFGDTAAFVSFGADGADDTFDDDGQDHSVSFDLSGTGPVKTNLIATAVVGSSLEDVAEASREVYLFEVSDTVIEGRVMGPNGDWGGGDDFVILRMTLTNPDDPANSTIVYENFAPVQNPDQTLQDETIGLFIPAEVGETLSITYSVDARDNDLDTGSDSASVTVIDDDTTILEIDDDGPGVTGSPDTVDLWEDGLTDGGRPDGDGEAEDVTASGNLSDIVNAGTDGVKDFGFTPDTSFTDALDALNLSSGGVPLTHFVEIDYNAADDDRLIAVAGTEDTDPIVYEVIVAEDGGYTINVFEPMDHPNGGGGLTEEDVLIVDFTDGLVALEGDNDPIVFEANTLRLRLEDDAPAADVILGTEPGVQYLYEGNTTSDGNFQGNTATSVPTSDVAASAPPTSTTVSFAGAFSTAHAYGADGAGTTATDYDLLLTPAIGSNVMLNDGTDDVAATSNDDNLVWAAVTGGYAAVIAGTTDEVFRITVDASGDVTFALTGVIDSPVAESSAPFTDDIMTLSDGQLAIRRTDTVTDNDGDVTSDAEQFDLGGNFGIGDDAADITSLGDVPTLLFESGDSETGNGVIEYGADGDGGFRITSVDPVVTTPDTLLGTITSEVVDDHTVLYKSSAIDATDGDGATGDGRFLQIVLDPTTGDYVATVLADAPLVEVPLIGGSTTPGGPVEEFTPDPPGNIVTFDGFIFDTWDADGTPRDVLEDTNSLKHQFENGGDDESPVNSGDSDEDINIDTNGIGLENAIMNEGEGLLLSFTSPVAGVSIDFEGPTGGLKTFAIRLEAYDADGNLVDELTLDSGALSAPKGPTTLTYDFVASGDFTDIYISTDLAGNDAIRIPEISAFTYADIDDLAGTVNVELSDFDGDTDTDSFGWRIDGDGDGDVTLPA